MKPHRPRFYRYLVGLPVERRLMVNRYGWRVIGASMVVGRYAYCVKWGWAS